MDTQLRGLVHAFLEQQGMKKAAKAMAKELKKKGLPAPPLEAALQCNYSVCIHSIQ